MSRSYGRTAFTDDVAREQERYGSQRFYARHQARQTGADGSDPLTDEGRDCLAHSDSFYLARSSETGWPYVQYRGGLPGFLKVLGEHSVGWAERLKIYGHLCVRSPDEDPDLLARLAGT